jgi:hypothetical protein
MSSSFFWYVEFYGDIVMAIHLHTVCEGLHTHATTAGLNSYNRYHMANENLKKATTGPFTGPSLTHKNSTPGRAFSNLI